MPDAFISYSSQDEELAKFVSIHLKQEGLSVFMAGLSLRPGQAWSSEIIENLKNSGWVILLASEAACRSAYVQQELGVALAGDKNIVPIVWDKDVRKLPGWINQKQALDLKSLSAEQARDGITNIARDIKQDVIKGLLIAGLIIAGLVILYSRGT